MKRDRYLGWRGAFVLLGLSALACDDAQTTAATQQVKLEPPATAVDSRGATPAPAGSKGDTGKGGDGKGGDGKVSKRLGSSADSTKTYNAASAALSNARFTQAQKQQLADAVVRIVAGFNDRDPAPWGPKLPPVDPPAAEPCKDCGSVKALPGDPCGKIRDDLKKLREQIDVLEAVRTTLTLIQDKKATFAFYAGVADALANVVSAGSALVTAGGGAALTAAARKILAGVAKAQLQEYIMDLVADSLPPPFDAAVSGTLDAAAIDALLAGIKNKLKPLYNEKNQLNAALSKCVADYKAELVSIKAGNDAVLACRRSNPAYCE